MASGKDLLQYVTKQLVTYMDTPKHARRQKKNSKEHWSYRWFGLVPISLKVWSQKTKLRKLRLVRLRNTKKGRDI